MDSVGSTLICRGQVVEMHRLVDAFDLATEVACSGECVDVGNDVPEHGFGLRVLNQLACSLRGCILSLFAQVLSRKKGMILLFYNVARLCVCVFS